MWMCSTDGSAFVALFCTNGSLPRLIQPTTYGESLAHAAELQYSSRHLEAERYYRAALSLAPTSGEAYYRLARLQHQRSHSDSAHLERAIRSLRHAVALQPRHDGAYHRLGLLLQTSGDEDRGRADQAMRLHDELWSSAAARRLLAPRLWAADDLAHHLLAHGVTATRAVAESAHGHGDATTCGMSILVEAAQPLALLQRCGLALDGAGAEAAAVSAVAALQTLLRSRGKEGRRLLGAEGERCDLVVDADRRSLIARAWMDGSPGALARCLRYVALVLSTDICSAESRAIAVRWAVMALASMDEPGAVRWLSSRAIALGMFARAEQTAQPDKFERGLRTAPFWSVAAHVKLVEARLESLAAELMQMPQLRAPWDDLNISSTGLMMSGRHRRVALGTACDECRDGDGQQGGCCAETLQLLALAGVTPSSHVVEAWVLGPHSAVRPHTGPTNMLLTVQCALSASAGNWIRVGRQVRPVVRGKCLVFDDSFIHELWNSSPETRVTLSWRVGHPEGAQQEMSAHYDADTLHPQPRPVRPRRGKPVVALPPQMAPPDGRVSGQRAKDARVLGQTLLVI